MQLSIVGGFCQELHVNVLFTNLVTGFPSNTFVLNNGVGSWPMKDFPFVYYELQDLSFIFSIPTLLI
jgi:hypothetical protein